MKNVFVLCTGRCGSKTFSMACKHFTNFTSAHESRTGLIGEARFDYPEHHIESDNRLSWLLGRLEHHFGDDAFYVHLTRDPEQVANSYANRVHFKGSIMRAYKDAILLRGKNWKRDCTPEEYALDYVQSVTQNIKSFLSNKSNQIHIDIASAQDNFLEFADRIGANGNLDAALDEFNTRHNARR